MKIEILSNNAMCKKPSWPKNVQKGKKKQLYPPVLYKLPLGYFGVVMHLWRTWLKIHMLLGIRAQVILQSVKKCKVSYPPVTRLCHA